MYDFHCSFIIYSNYIMIFGCKICLRTGNTLYYHSSFYSCCFFSLVNYACFDELSFRASPEEKITLKRMREHVWSPTTRCKFSSVVHHIHSTFLKQHVLYQWHYLQGFSHLHSTFDWSSYFWSESKSREGCGRTSKFRLPLQFPSLLLSW